MGQRTTANITVNVLFKKDGHEWIGHCLEFDIVATGTNFKKLKAEMKDLIIAQVEYAFANDNLDYLFHPAPAEVWKEFYNCKDVNESKFKLSPPTQSRVVPFIPPSIIANMCRSENLCHA